MPIDYKATASRWRTKYHIVASELVQAKELIELLILERDAWKKTAELRLDRLLAIANAGFRIGHGYTRVVVIDEYGECVHECVQTQKTPKA